MMRLAQKTSERRRAFDTIVSEARLTGLFTPEALGELRVEVQGPLLRVVMAADPQVTVQSPYRVDGVDLDAPVSRGELVSWLATRPGARLVGVGASLCPLRAPEGVINRASYVAAVEEGCPECLVDAMPGCFFHPFIDGPVLEMLRTHWESFATHLTSRHSWWNELTRLPDDLVLASLDRLGDSLRPDRATRVLKGVREGSASPALHRHLCALMREQWIPGQPINTTLFGPEQLAALLESAGPKQIRPLIAEIASQGDPAGLDVIAAATQNAAHGDVACLALALCGVDGARAVERLLAARPSIADPRLARLRSLPSAPSAFAFFTRSLSGEAPNDPMVSYRVPREPPPPSRPPTERTLVLSTLARKTLARGKLTAAQWCDCLQVLSFCEYATEAEVAWDRAHDAGLLGLSNHPSSLAQAVDRLDWSVVRGRSGSLLTRLWEVLSWCEAPREVFVHAASLQFPGRCSQIDKSAKALGAPFALALSELNKALCQVAQAHRARRRVPAPLFVDRRVAIAQRVELGRPTRGTAWDCELDGVDSASFSLGDALTLRVSTASHVCEVVSVGMKRITDIAPLHAREKASRVTFFFFADGIEVHAGPKRIFSKRIPELVEGLPLHVEAEGTQPRAHLRVSAFQPESLARASSSVIAGSVGVELLGQHDTPVSARHLAAVAMFGTDESLRTDALKQLKARRSHAAEARALVGLDANVEPPPDFVLRPWSAVVEAVGGKVGTRNGREAVTLRTKSGETLTLEHRSGSRPSSGELVGLLELPADLSSFSAAAILRPRYDILSFMVETPTRGGAEALVDGLHCGLAGAFDVVEGHVFFRGSTPLVLRWCPEELAAAISLPFVPTAFDFDVFAKPGPEEIARGVHSFNP